MWPWAFGELDLMMAQAIAHAGGQLTFVEVQTRSQGNWDADGLMTITRSKQAKLWKAAQLYLLKHSQWAEATCRFDAAFGDLSPQQTRRGQDRSISQTRGRPLPSLTRLH